MDYLSKINLGGLGRLFKSSKGLSTLLAIVIGMVLRTNGEINGEMFFIMTVLLVIVYAIMTGLEDGASKFGVSSSEILTWLEVIAASDTLPKEAVKLASDALEVIKVVEGESKSDDKV